MGCVISEKSGKSLVRPGEPKYNRSGGMQLFGAPPHLVHQEHAVEEPLKQLMQDLGSAINESLSDSERIAEAIGEIKRAGYDVFLVLEATIGFNKRSGEESEGEEENKEMGVSHRIKFTSQDQRFLKALKIAVDEDAN